MANPDADRDLDRMAEIPDSVLERASAPELDVPSFLGAVRDDASRGTDLARVVLRDTAFRDTAGGPQAQGRAKELVDNGEWDQGPELPLTMIREEVGLWCRAPVGDQCFCLNRSLAVGGTCAVSSHRNQLTIQPGWYVRRQKTTTPKMNPSAFTDPYFPLRGSLDRLGVQEALLSEESPLSLTRGQWKYVFKEIALYEAFPASSPGTSSSSGSAVMVPSPRRAATSGGLSTLSALAARLAAVREETSASASPGRTSPSGAPPPVAASSSSGSDSVASATLEDLVGKLTLRLNRLEAEQGQSARREEEARARERGLMARIVQVETENSQYGKLINGALDMVSDLHSRPHTTSGGRFTPIMDGLAHVTARTDRLEETCYQPNGELEGLRRSLNLMRDQLALGGVEFGEHHFTSTTAFKEWFLRHSPSGRPTSFGLFWDAFALLHNLAPGTVAMQDSLKADEAVQKVRYATTAEARVATSFTTAFPDVFGSSGQGDKFGKTLKTYADWKNTGSIEGVSYVIRDSIEEDVISIKGDIAATLNTGPLRTLAEGMVSRAAEDVRDFLRFVDEFYEEMNAAASMSSVEAWELTKTAMSEILKDIRCARNRVKNHRQTDRTMHVWGVLLGHAAVKEYTDRSWKNHHHLAGIQMRFVLKRKSDLDGLEQVNAKHKALENKLNGITQRFDKVEKEVAKKK